MKAKDKRFLNDSHEEFASVSWYVTNEDKVFYNFMESEVRIADCHNVITLDFNCADIVAAKKRLQKLDNLIESLSEMRVAMSDIIKDTSKSKPY